MSQEQRIGLGPLFTDSYDLGTPREITPLAGGLVHDISKIRTEKGVFVHKAYKTESRQGLEEELRLLLFLQNNGFPVPSVVKTKHGKDIVEDHGERIGYVYRFIDGKIPNAPNQLSMDQARAAGRLLGIYHKLARDFHGSIGNPSGFPLYNPDNFFSQTKIADLWQRMLSKPSAEADNETDKQIRGVAEEKLKRLERLDESWVNGVAKNLPRVRAHGDYQGTNLIFDQEGGIKAVIDWEFSRELARAWELQYAITLACKVANTENFNTPLDIAKVRAIIEGYKSVISLSEAELTAMPIMAYVASFNPLFLLEAKYVHGKSTLDPFIPRQHDDWFWWDNNIDRYYNAIL